MQQTKHSMKGFLFLIISQTMVGINIVCAKYLINKIPTVPLLTIRFILAALMLFPLHWLTHAGAAPLKQHLTLLRKKDWLFILAQALSAGILFNCLMLWGLHYTDANKASIITSALPALIALISWLFIKETISAKNIFCILFATIGLIVIASEKFTNTTQHSSLFGDLLIICSLLPEAAYYVLCKIHPNRLPIFLISSLINAINALCLLPVYLYLPLTFPPLANQDYCILLILGLSSGLFYACWLIGCQQVESGLASLATAVMPIATVVFAWIFLNENLTIGQGAGMLLVILSIAVYARK